MAVGLPTAPGPGRAPDADQATTSTSASASGPGSSAAARVPPAAHRAETVSAPVRIADAASVRLLHPGDRVDVLAAADTDTGTGTGSGAETAPKARVVARAARVARLPEPSGAASGDTDGALIVLTVPRPTATALIGASVSARLAVTLC
ncbi:hypothetical protein ACZ90_07200 [Streptomyces albus subsp. albus]|nr:hypothetical protein ACZ90_07200 [Streptomyces albus subsp. albus]